MTHTPPHLEMPLFFLVGKFGGGRRLHPRMGGGEAFGFILWAQDWVLACSVHPTFFFFFSFPYKSRPPPSRFSKTGVEAYPPPVYTDLIVVSPHPPDDVAVRAVALAAVRTPTPHLEYAAVASGVVSDAAAI